jgi:solute carrier family 39 (zinc transporter), member 1/2/3
MFLTLVNEKIVAALFLFVLALFTGFLPSRFSKSHSHLLHKGDSFARGVFLSAALLHMLPTAEAKLRMALPNAEYPFCTLIVVCAFMFLFTVENSIVFFIKRRPLIRFKVEYTTPYLLSLLIMIHAAIEGAAIGINSTLASAAVIFFAVTAHKGSESFALAANLQKNNLPASLVKKIVLIFSLMTPIGILFATGINQFFMDHSGQLTEAIFDAFAAGTFLYLGTVHSLAEPESLDCHQELFAMGLGAILMAVVAIWV